MHFTIVNILMEDPYERGGVSEERQLTPCFFSAHAVNNYSNTLSYIISTNNNIQNILFFELFLIIF